MDAEITKVTTTKNQIELKLKALAHSQEIKTKANAIEIISQIVKKNKPQAQGFWLI